VHHWVSLSTSNQCHHFLNHSIRLAIGGRASLSILINLKANPVNINKDINPKCFLKRDNLSKMFRKKFNLSGVQKLWRKVGHII